MGTPVKVRSGATLRYFLFITLAIMVGFGFMRLVNFQRDKENANVEELLISITDLKALNHLLQAKSGQLENALAQTNKTNMEYKEIINILRTSLAEKETATPENTRGEPTAPATTGPIEQTTETTENKQEVITNYDSLVYVQKYFNTHGEIQNKDKFTLAPDFIPIVIRVFDKHEYVKYVLDSYRNVKGINETIIVFSHDGIFPEVFKVVESIDFCQVKQIIHPYSGHTLTNRFPGKDPTLPHHVDQYGNPRPFPHTALKHHYWWHLNTAWDVLFPNHTGDIILMEEDHVPTFDFYITLKNLARIRDKECPEDCFNVQLHEHGVYEQMMPRGDVHQLVKSGLFGNIGISFNRKNFIKVKKAAKVFCEFDDYNWDWSTIFLQTRGLIPRHTLVPVIPRAVHLGKCGTHYKGTECGINDHEAQKAKKYDKQILAENGDVWDKYTISNNPAFTGHSKGYGGWAHPADHAHCMAQVKPNPNFAEEERV